MIYLLSKTGLYTDGEIVVFVDGAMEACLEETVQL
jgi:hypothetical protein